MTAFGIVRVVTPLLLILDLSWNPVEAADWSGLPVPGGSSVSSPTHCGTLLMNGDSEYEYAYQWQYGAIVPPDWGSFAECFAGVVSVCSLVFDFTATAGWGGEQRVDVFLWEDLEGLPGAVLYMGPGPTGPIADWPHFSRMSVAVTYDCTPDAWWVGYWGDWPDSWGDRWVGADLDGPAGCPMTKIAPGTGYPTGWQNVSVVWGPTQALGIGAEVNECTSTPTKRTSWGAIKALYQ